MADYRVIDAEQLESDLTVVADAIREKGGTSEQLPFPNGMVDAVRGIQSGGVDYLRYCKTVQFNNINLFGKEEIVLNLDNSTELAYLYQSASASENTTVKHITVNCQNQIKSMRNAFCGLEIYDKKLERITLNVDTSKSEWWVYSFAKMYALKIIDGNPLDLRNVNANGYSNMFLSDGELVEVRFEETSIVKTISFGHSSKLSDASIQSIIDGLADLTGQTAQTITFHADIKAKLTEAQISQITSKNWTLA